VFIRAIRGEILASPILNLKFIMATKTKTKSKKSTKAPAASLCWFDIAADDIGRAKKFYSSLFGWKIQPIPGMPDYSHIDTGGPDSSPDGGLTSRKCEGHGITNYISVASVARSAAKVEKLGGKILMPKTAVPKMGYFAVCLDTEKNAFALWEMSPTAK
jgi:predicted enzyme related to lactoylglutathione lyase